MNTWHAYSVICLTMTAPPCRTRQQVSALGFIRNDIRAEYIHPGRDGSTTTNLCLECALKRTCCVCIGLSWKQKRTYLIGTPESGCHKNWNNSISTVRQKSLFPVIAHVLSCAQDMTNASMSGCSLNWYAMSIWSSMSTK